MRPTGARARRRAGSEPGLQVEQGRLARRRWAGFKVAERPTTRAAAIPASLSRSSGRSAAHHRVPQGFHVHRPTIQRFLAARAKAIETGEGIDWATGEALAFCTLLREGNPVRLSGQDSETRDLLAAPFGADRPGDRGPLYAVQPRPRTARRATRSSTRCCPRRPCSASSTAIRSPSPTRSRCGKRSSATSPTARRSCSTSSSPRANANGCACPGLRLPAAARL